MLLDEKTKRLIVLREQGLSWRIIAVRLGMSMSTVLDRHRRYKKQQEKKNAHQ